LKITLFFFIYGLTNFLFLFVSPRSQIIPANGIRIDGL